MNTDTAETDTALFGVTRLSLALCFAIFLLVASFTVLAQQPPTPADAMVTNDWVDVVKIPPQSNLGTLSTCFATRASVFVPVPIFESGRALGEAISNVKNTWAWYKPQNSIFQCFDTGRVRYQILLKSAAPKTPFADDATKLDPKHNEILFANERVRVVRVHFGPGESGPMVDKRARVIIMLTDSHATVTLPDGHSEVRDGKAGTVAFSKGGRQATNNVGTTELENIVVELKNK